FGLADRNRRPGDAARLAVRMVASRTRDWRATATRYRRLAGEAERASRSRRRDAARRSRRLLCDADGDPLIGEIAVEQDVVLDLMHANLHTAGLIGPVERRQLDPGTARAQHDGRDADMQPVETSRRDEARHRIGATLDQDPAHPRAGERRD